MTQGHRIPLANDRVVNDLHRFAERAKHLQATSMRLQVQRNVLVTTVNIFSPLSLGDQMPYVLGVRTVGLNDSEDQAGVLDGLDRVYPLQAITDRTSRMTSQDITWLTLPPVEEETAWTGMTPPRTQWRLVAVIDDAELSELSRQGIRHVAETLPTSPGAAMVHQARTAVWGETYGDPAVAKFPAGMAFAASGLSFLTQRGTSQLFRAGVWLRLTSRGGHIVSRPAITV